MEKYLLGTIHVYISFERLLPLVYLNKNHNKFMRSTSLAWELAIDKAYKNNLNFKLLKCKEIYEMHLKF